MIAIVAVGQPLLHMDKHGDITLTGIGLVVLVLIALILIVVIATALAGIDVLVNDVKERRENR